MSTGGAALSRFEVDPEMLGVAAGRVDGYVARIADAVGLRSAVGDLGSARLTGVVEDTESAISRDAEEVMQALRCTSVSLRSAGATYHQADERTRQAAAGGAG